MSTDAQTDYDAPAFHTPTSGQDEIPPLENGDRLSRDEFELRYAAMPHLKKAELIDGVVYVMSMPVSLGGHASPQADILYWLGHYAVHTEGLQVFDNGTVRLDWDNEPQPDAAMRILPAYGGQSTDDDDYVGGAPEFCCEIAASSASYDLHQKKAAFRRNGVREYLVWRTKDSAIDWFVLRGGEYQRLEPDSDGVLRSETFPGLWLNGKALLARSSMRPVLATLNDGLASQEYLTFRDRLAVAGPKS